MADGRFRVRLGSVTISAGILIAAAAAMWLFGECRYNEGARDQELKAAGDTVDRHRARLVAQILELESKVRRDSVAHAAALSAAASSTAAARQHSDSLEAALKKKGPLPADVRETIDALHGTIDAQAKELAQKDRTILFWQGVAAERGAQRDSAAAQRDEYKRQRDQWQRRARPRCGADVGVGYGATTHQVDGWVGYGCRIPLPRIPFL
jgi:hypothetical protein